MSTSAALTLAEAASWLDPPVTEEQLRALVRALGIKSSGSRRTGHSGPGVKVYDAAELIDLHSAVARWLVRSTGWLGCVVLMHGERAR